MPEDGQSRTANRAERARLAASESRLPQEAAAAV